MTRTVEAIRAELAEVNDKIDRGYWAFTRQARGKLAPAETYRKRAALNEELRARTLRIDTK